MQCITIAFWQVNYALKSGKFQDAAFIRSSMQGGVDRTLFQPCDGMFNNFFWPCFPEVVFIIGIPFPPCFHFMETLMLKITALFMQLEPLPRSRGRIIWNDKGNNRNLFFKWICLMCLWTWISQVFKDPSVWRGQTLPELQASRQETGDSSVRGGPVMVPRAQRSSSPMLGTGETHGKSLRD